MYHHNVISPGSDSVYGVFYRLPACVTACYNLRRLKTVKIAQIGPAVNTVKCQYRDYTSLWKCPAQRVNRTHEHRASLYLQKLLGNVRAEACAASGGYHYHCYHANIG